MRPDLMTEASIIEVIEDTLSHWHNDPNVAGDEFYMVDLENYIKGLKKFLLENGELDG